MQESAVVTAQISNWRVLVGTVGKAGGCCLVEAEAHPDVEVREDQQRQQEEHNRGQLVERVVLQHRIVRYLKRTGDMSSFYTDIKFKLQCSMLMARVTFLLLAISEILPEHVSFYDDITAFSLPPRSLNILCLHITVSYYLPNQSIMNFNH
jgi:uncharacterized membrane protein affecting hemolysin expression